MTWTPRLRLALSAAFFSAWMVLLLTGFAFGGAVHLLLAAALVCFPWRSSGAVPDRAAKSEAAASSIDADTSAPSPQ